MLTWVCLLGVLHPQMVFGDESNTSGNTAVGMVHPGVLKDRVASPAGALLSVPT
jgi:hypothetical protein